MSAWIFALLLAVVPPGQHPRETYDVAVHRYASIADDIASVTTHRANAALLVAIAVHESGLRADVDTGETLGDGGRARGLWQLQGVPSDLSRAEQASVALARVQRSFRACGAGGGTRWPPTPRARAPEGCRKAQPSLIPGIES